MERWWNEQLRFNRTMERIMKFVRLRGGLLAVLPLLFALACGREPSPEQAVAQEREAGVQEEVRGVPVEVLVVRAKRVEQAMSLIGVLQPRHAVEIVAEVQGKAERVEGEVGDAIGLRDTLAFIDERIPLSQYRQARAQVLSAENGLKIARLELESDGELLASGDISRLAYDNSELAVKAAEAARLSALAQLSATEKQYLDTRIISPIAGLIARKYVEAGTMVTAGMPLFRVVDLSALKAEVGVPQDLVSRVRAGSPARVRVSALNGRSFDGVVRSVSPQADAQSGAFAVEVQVENTGDRAIRAGMTAEVEITFGDRQRRLAVPEYAVVTKNGDRYVYRVARGVASLSPISVAEVLGSQVIVADGLTEQDTIVVVGMKNLGVETRVWIETIH